MDKNQEILIRNGLISIPTDVDHEHISEAELATLMGNITTYGFGLNEEGLSALNCLTLASATTWWNGVKEILETITGADKKMGDAVVYKNFPSEVLAMDEAAYWGRQILMYWGFDKELFREREITRELKTEKIRLRILQLDDGNGLERIQLGLLKLPARWTEQQLAHARHLAPNYAHLCDLSMVSFKENMVELAKVLLELGVPFKSTSATDVLRLAVGLSGGDVSMRTPSKFARFPNKTRKFLTRALGSCKNLQEDMTRDLEKWKHLVKAIHPGDHSQHGDGVLAAVDALYKGTLPQTFNGIVETKLRAKDATVLGNLKTRPGEFVRRLRICLQQFGMDAATTFAAVVPKLETIQLLKIEGFLTTFNDRKQVRAFPPKGNYGKVQLEKAEDFAKIPSINIEAIKLIVDAIGVEIKTRLDPIVGSVNLDERTKLVKLQDNGAELASYGRGTRFSLPTDVKFVRTASYWKGQYTAWFDNGVNFFDADWKSKGAVCWTNYSMGKAAVFSGDPVSGNGAACQMIDCYLDELKALGIRYAVWNILCYSRVEFDAYDVHAAIQWGVEPQSGKIFDPARTQLSFPVKGKAMSKFITYLDVEARELVYLDISLPVSTHSAESNEARLQDQLPPILANIAAAPTVYDLFKHQKQDPKGVPVMYDDATTRIESGKAYVFKQANKDNSFEQLNVAELL